MLIETETTPNPSTLKFLPGQPVMEAGTRDFASPKEAEASPLAEALFDLGDVEGVFFGQNFISVTVAPGGDWRDLKPQVLGVLLDHYAGGAPLFRAGSASAIEIADEDFGEDPADADIVDQIKDLIATRVRPAVAKDVGDIVDRGSSAARCSWRCTAPVRAARRRPRRSSRVSSSCSSTMCRKLPTSARSDPRPRPAEHP